MGDAMLGTVTAGFYSPLHPSALNKAYVDAFKTANPTFQPNFLSVSGYDGMHLIYAALEKSHGSTDGDVLVSAMKGMAWESPPVRSQSIRIHATSSIMSTSGRSKEWITNSKMWNSAPSNPSRTRLRP
jgi:ABC-type branched-subunit amino acid transport system substrate-binding protein